MNKHLIYDLPTRIFHWIFAALFVATFYIAKSIDDDSPVFSYHMLAGLMLAGLVALRIIWGFIGSRYARFTSFALNPRDLGDYIKGILTGDKKRWSGHNPASSWASIVMMVSAIMLATTGILMTSGDKETYEDIHELFANAFLITTLLHIAGVLLHSLKHQDGIALAMVHGKKEILRNEVEVVRQRPIVALVFVLLIGAFANHLYTNYNTQTQSLKFFGKNLTLGEESQGNEEDENEVEDD